MVLDKEEHRTVLLELIDHAAIQGSAVEVVFAIKRALREARVEAESIEDEAA